MCVCVCVGQCLHGGLCLYVEYGVNILYILYVAVHVDV